MQTIIHIRTWLILLLVIAAAVQWDCRVAQGGEHMVNSVLVVVEGPPSPLVSKAAELLCEQINARCRAAICTEGDGKLRIVLTLKPGIGREGFRIEEGPDSAIRIVGNDARGLIYGVGKFLRGSRFGEGAFGPSTWKGASVPEKPVRGIYFGAFANYYCTAPPDEIRRYVEELALWAATALPWCCPWRQPGRTIRRDTLGSQGSGQSSRPDAMSACPLLS